MTTTTTRLETTDAFVSVSVEYFVYAQEVIAAAGNLLVCRDSGLTEVYCDRQWERLTTALSALASTTADDGEGVTTPTVK
jgi:hypothetical protein